MWGDNSTEPRRGPCYTLRIFALRPENALLRLLLFLSVTLLAAVTVACGGDNGRPKAEVKTALSGYFEQYLKIHEDVNRRIVGLKAKYPKGYLDLTDKSAADLQQTKDSYREYSALFDEFDSRVRALDPPAEISDLAQQVLAADQAISAINHDRLAKVEAVSSTAELDTIFAENPTFTAAVEHTVEVCTSMIERAKQYDYELDLPCRG